MPMDIILAGIDKASAALLVGPKASTQAAEAIMTTDTCPKYLAVELVVGGKTVRIGGMTKGAGMIAPAMKLQPPQATMLAYITTDAAVSRAALDQCLAESLDLSFNRITVDGDTSTNDTFLALANGLAGNDVLEQDSPDFAAFCEAFTFVVARLAKEMVLDGEGVTRFVELSVTGAKDDAEARTCAEAIANSALCKTAWFGADPNWGRVLCAAGYSGVAVNTDRVSLDYEGVPIVRGGMNAGTPEAEQVKAISKREFRIDLDLGVADGAFTIWTCDLTYEYVKINADYHT
jgi:glutamate N-acetyltransferase/amino-acid N-acetyltransferase